MNSKVYETTRWTGGTNVVARLRETTRHVTRAWAGWRDSAKETVGAHFGLLARRNRQRGPACFDLKQLTRQEEIELVQRVFLTPGVHARRAVLFAGVEGDNGCAGICIRAGQALARLRPQPVCIVDADPRSAALHRLLGVENHGGWAAAVEQAASVRTFARQLAPNNLWLLPAGSSASDPDLLLATDRIRPRLQELGGLFDYILINAPPINVYAEALALSQFVDGAVLVLEANATRREIVRNVKSRLAGLNVPLLGIVLNNRAFPIPQALYRLL